ncbi:hypothetical protein F5148DRAFT_1162639, partial [Russula earlei]
MSLTSSSSLHCHAGGWRLPSIIMQVDPPPPISADTSAPDLARKRFSKGKYLNLGLPRFTNLKAWRTRSRSAPLVERTILPNDTAEIDLGDSGQDFNGSQDIYKWAVIYENQRGVTLFSTPYYSRSGLLPHDPPPFTIPEADGRRDRQPQVSLHHYPLPDGTWSWVSTSWMVDMRSEGEVNYDGFEYNWVFRRYKWRPEPGVLSAGGWVRRRRWIRLMMRPAHPTANEQSDGGEGQHPHETSPLIRYSVVPDNSPFDLETEKAMVWKGDLDDWKRCHHLMARLNRDGAKLEVWREWLGVSPRTRQRIVWTEDDNSLPSEEPNGEHIVRAPVLEGPQRDSLVTVVKDHVEELIQLFIYPESRVELFEMLRAANITVRRDSQSAFEDGGVEFWSYRERL